MNIIRVECIEVHGVMGYNCIETWYDDDTMKQEFVSYAELIAAILKLARDTTYDQIGVGDDSVTVFTMRNKGA